MTFSYWCFAIVFAPAVILGLMFRAYDVYVVGSETKAERKLLQDYSAGEIGFNLLAGVLLFGVLLGGAILLDTYEPASKMLCYLYYATMSLPLLSVMVIDRLMKRRHKSALFGILFFLMFLLPALFAFVGIYRNGAGDKAPAQMVRVIVVSKTTSLSRAGRIYHAVFQSPDLISGPFRSPRSYQVSRRIYGNLKTGQEMTLYLKPGGLGIPWIEKLVVDKSSTGRTVQGSGITGT